MSKGIFTPKKKIRAGPSPQKAGPVHVLLFYQISVGFTTKIEIISHLSLTAVTNEEERERVLTIFEDFI